MAIQLLRGTTAQIASNSNTSIAGQPLYDIDKHILYIGDGETAINELEGIELGLNLNNGSAEGSLQQSEFVYSGESVEFSDGTKGTQNGDIVPGAIASGIGSAAFGGLRYDYYTSPETHAANQVINSESTENWNRTPTSAEGAQSFAFGGSCHAIGNWSVSGGKDSTAVQRGSISLGGSCRAGMTEEEFNDFWWDSTTLTAKNGGKGMIDGFITDSQGYNYQQAYSFALALGDTCLSTGRGSVALGKETKARNQAAVAMGFTSQATGDGSVALGYKSLAQGDGSVALGESTASGYRAVALGNSLASGRCSASFGTSTASGDYAIASGLGSVAEGINAISFGYRNTASADTSISIGGNNTSKRNASTSIGQTNTVYSTRGIAIGSNNIVGSADEDNAQYGIAIGMGLKSTAYRQFVIGKYNESKPDSVFELGDGTASAPKNLLDVDWKGNLRVYAAPSDAKGDIGSCVLRYSDISSSSVPQGSGYDVRFGNGYFKSIECSGDVNAVNGTFTGDITGQSGTFTGDVSAVNGIFDVVDAGTGNIDNVNAGIVNVTDKIILKDVDINTVIHDTSSEVVDSKVERLFGFLEYYPGATYGPWETFLALGITNWDSFAKDTSKTFTFTPYLNQANEGEEVYTTLILKQGNYFGSSSMFQKISVQVVPSFVSYESFNGETSVVSNETVDIVYVPSTPMVISLTRALGGITLVIQASGETCRFTCADDISQGNKVFRVTITSSLYDTTYYSGHKLN